MNKINNLDDDDANNDLKNNNAQELENLIQKQQRKSFYLEQINILYKKVIEPFQKAQSIIYDPYLFNDLTREKFIDWVINNNNDIAEYFDL